MSIILGAGQTKRLDASLTAVILPGSIRGYVSDKSTNQGISYAHVQIDSNVVVSDTDGYYSFSVNAGTFTLKCFVANYQYFEKQVTVSAGEIKIVNIELTPLVYPGELVIRNLYVTPTVVVVDNPVSIVAQLVYVGFEGTVPVTCIVNGTQLTGYGTFSALKVWDDVTYTYTPPVAKTYTATVLGASVTFEAKEVVTAHYECPWCEGPYRIERTISPGMITSEVVPELTTEQDLILHIATPNRGYPYAGHIDYWEADTYYIECPYCDWRSFGDELSISSSVVEHIKANHNISCPICGVDLTFIGSALKFSEKYQEHMALHGKTVPSFWIKKLYEYEGAPPDATDVITEATCPYCGNRQVVPPGTTGGTEIVCDRCGRTYVPSRDYVVPPTPSVQQPFIQFYKPTICIVPPSAMPLYGGRGGGTTIKRSTCRGSYYYTEGNWETEERAKIVIPTLAGRNWQAKLAWYYEGNQYYGEAPRITEITTKSGYGQTVKLDNFLAGWDPDRLEYSNTPPPSAGTISLILSFDNEVMVINGAYQWQSNIICLERKLVSLEYSYDGNIKYITDARSILISWANAGYPPYGESVICSRVALGITTSRPSISEIEATYQNLYSAYTEIYNTKKSAIEALLAEYNNNWLDC